MSTLRVPIRLWLLVVAGCLVAALLDALQAYLQGTIGNAEPASWRTIVFQGTEWLFLAGLTPLAYYLGQRFPLRPPRLATALAVHLFGASLLCIAWASLGVLLRRALGTGWGTFREELASWTLTSVPWSFFMYFAMVGCFHAFSYYMESRERAALADRLTGQLAEARLNALRMQLHPHFLFNSLNAITVLVRDRRTELATRMLELLSDVLRQVLRSDQPHVVPVSEELQLIEQYLAIEQVRFSDRLRVQFSVDQNALGAAVPRFILQPLVENALRHGVAERTTAVTIEIGVARRDSELELWVRDDGPGFDETATRMGVGLENTRLRLATMYGQAATLQLSAAEGGGTIARIRIPYHEPGASDPGTSGADGHNA